MIASTDGVAYVLALRGSDKKAVRLQDESAQRRAGDLISVAVSPGGELLSVLFRGVGSGAVQVWDIERREPIGEGIPLPLEGWYDQVFSPDGRHLALMQLRRRPLLLDMSPESWRTRVCDRVQRNFTCSEWGRFFQDAPYRKVCPALAGPASCQ